ncbi:glycosyltransferase family 39 protein [Kovacikia minuta CCNUW1]|uniref:ArnT family glycosyltransferase n=1 Tax=Kovacikia minuta TaxID=2931930 RepID=UPI001CCF42BB|nr:glycosyltransferase family 39 protein [Kovacikia minuta]UBF26954.1 glycosyltransferase family 39 protein [Kovacikia minuta CCNUW1]
MDRKLSAWANFSNPMVFPKRWIDPLWGFGLFLAAGLLCIINLGGLPLRDWDEGIVAQVARDIWRAPDGSLTWLYPTIAGEPYLNKPPLMHWLVALAYQFGGVNEWTSRLPGALLTAISVPLLYGIGRELFLRQTPAVLAALVYMTLLPVARHGRLAMLDGGILCLFLLLLFCLLRTRRNLRWGLGVGAAFGLLCLTKGIVALLLGAIALTFIYLDTPRLLRSGYVWAGFLLGSLPVFAWYGAQWWRYRNIFINVTLQSQSLSRIWSSVESNGGPPWYYLLEILKYGLPWLIFLPWGCRLVWENRSMGWAKLVLVWTIGYLGAISLMSTKLPWYVLPVYPALALVIGMQLSQVWNSADFLGIPQSRQGKYPRGWVVLMGLVAIASWVATFYFGGLGTAPQLDLQLILSVAALTLTAATILVACRDSQFIVVLLWGVYLTLMLLMMSRYWVWELNEAYPVKPVAEMIQQSLRKQNAPPRQVVITTYPTFRPSLDFYSDRRVIPAAQLPPASDSPASTAKKIQNYWQQTPHPYLLTDPATLKQLKLEAVQQLGTAKSWLLVTRAGKSAIPTIHAESSGEKSKG